MLFSQEYDSQHRQVDKDDCPSPNFIEAMWGLIPPPDSTPPTKKNSPYDLPPRFGNKPKNEAVEKPSLRHTGRQQKQNRVAIAIPPQSKQQQRAGQNKKRYEVFVSVRLRNPKHRPLGQNCEADRCHNQAGCEATAARMSQEHWQPNLRLGHRYWQQKGKESGGGNDRRPWHREQSGPIRKSK